MDLVLLPAIAPGETADRLGSARAAGEVLREPTEFCGYGACAFAEDAGEASVSFPIPRTNRSSTARRLSIITGLVRPLGEFRDQTVVSNICSSPGAVR